MKLLQRIVLAWRRYWLPAEGLTHGGIAARASRKLAC